jgi:ABC-type uncharacterized transport system permease subunit
VMNMGLEGMMLFGVFTVWLVTFLGGTTIMGGGADLVVGALLGLLLGVLVIYLKVDQTVSGLSINLLAVGVGEYFHRMLNVEMETVSVVVLPNINIPFLAKIPYLGDVLFKQNPYTYLAFLSVPVIAWFLRRTKYGLTIRSTGENPKAVDTRGINVGRVCHSFWGDDGESRWCIFDVDHIPLLTEYDCWPWLAGDHYCNSR